MRWRVDIYHEAVALLAKLRGAATEQRTLSSCSAYLLLGAVLVMSAGCPFIPPPDVLPPTSGGTPAMLPSKYVSFALIPYHDAESLGDDAQCMDCHQNKLDEQAAYAEIPTHHSLMQGLFGADDARCLNCHTNGVDLVFGTTSRLRNEAFEAGWCASPACHGASSSLPFYAEDLK